MSLTQDDMQQIRALIREEVEAIVSPRFDQVDAKLETLENDIKEIYDMISALQKLTRPVAHFEKYDLEQKVLETYSSLLAIAKEAGITLPRQ